MPDYLVQEEDGTSKLQKEEADGFILLEESGAPATPNQSLKPVWRPRRRD